MTTPPEDPQPAPEAQPEPAPEAAPEAEAPEAAAPPAPEGAAEAPAEAPAADSPDAAEAQAPAPEAAAEGEPAAEAAAEEDAPKRKAGGDTVLIEAAAETVVDTFRLGLRIIPHPNKGIAEYARSRPGATSLALIGLVTVLYPLLNWLTSGVTQVRLFLEGLMSISIAHVALALVLVLGLKIHYRKSFDRRELLAVYAASLIPFIPAILVGWLLTFIKPASAKMMFVSGVVCGVVLAAQYLRSALRELYELTPDQAMYFSALCYSIWTLVFYSGLTTGK